MAKAKKKPKKTTNRKRAKPVGRPTAYLTKYRNIAPYLRDCQKNKLLPTIVGYAIWLNFPQQRLHEWAKNHPEFQESLGRIKEIQENTLINKGLNGEYSPAIAKLILSNNHGYCERTDHTSGDEPLAPPVINMGGKK